MEYLPANCFERHLNDYVALGFFYIRLVPRFHIYLISMSSKQHQSNLNRINQLKALTNNVIWSITHFTLVVIFWLTEIGVLLQKHIWIIFKSSQVQFGLLFQIVAKVPEELKFPKVVSEWKLLKILWNCPPRRQWTTEGVPIARFRSALNISIHKGFFANSSFWLG